MKDESERAKILRKKSVDDFNRDYKAGKITLIDKNRYLREKAKLEFYGDEGGYVDAVTQKFIHNMQENWDSLVEAARHDQTPSKAGDQPGGSGSVGQAMTKDVLRELWYAGKATWAMINMVPIVSIPAAFGDVHHKMAEQIALKNGASPGLAWWIGLAADIGTGIVPTQILSKSIVKTAQAGGARLASAAASAGTQDARLVSHMAKALSKEGVAIDDAGNFVTKLKQAASEATAKQGEEIAKKAIEVGDKAGKIMAAGEAAPPTFLEDARKIASEIGANDARKALPELMKKFGISWQDLKEIKSIWGGSRSMSAEQFYGYLSALEKHSGELSKLAKAALAPGATDVEKTAFIKGATELFSGVQGKPAYTKEFMDLLVHWDPANIAKGDINAAMTTFATDMATIGARDTARLAYHSQDNYVRFGLPPAYLKEMFINLLLPISGPAAFLGNSIGVGTMVAERMASGHPLEAYQMMKGMTLGVADAAQAFKMAYQTGGVRHAMPGLGGSVIGAGADTMIAIDSAFKVIAFRGSLYGDAMRLYGSNGAAIRAYVTNPPPDAIQRGIERAYRATYQNDLGQFASLFRDASQYSAGSMYFLFMKNPLNLVKWGWDRTPGIQFLSGRLWQDILAGGTQADDAMARITMANLQAMMVWELAKEGTITGSGPANPELRQAWLATHEPYSIRTPVGWVPYNYIDPITMPIALVADLAQLADQIDEHSLGQGAAAAAFAFMHDVADRTMWRTLSDLVDVAKHAENAERLRKRDVEVGAAPISSILTGGSVGGRTARVMDPVKRDARDFIQSLMVKTPWGSDKVAPMRDAYGDVIIPPQVMGYPWFAYFSPLVPKIKPESTDRIKVEGANLQVKVPEFPDHVGGGSIPDDMSLREALPGQKVAVYITPDQRDRWKQIYRNIIRHPEIGLEKFMDSDVYKNAPPAGRRQMFGDFLATAKKNAEQGLILEDKELAKKVMQSTLDQVKPWLNAEQTEQANIPEAQRAIDLWEGLTAEQKDNITKWGLLEPDKPARQEAITIGGVEVVGPKEYKPREHLFTDMPKHFQKELLTKDALPVGIPGGGDVPKTDVTVTPAVPNIPQP